VLECVHVQPWTSDCRLESVLPASIRSAGWNVAVSYIWALQSQGCLPCAALQENNFKAVLESMRDLMNEQTIVPPWLHDTFLGYGDPSAAQYTKQPDFRRTVDFKVLQGIHITAPAMWNGQCRADRCCAGHGRH
jgi:Intron-binding protein aquarius N-terminus